MSPAGRRPPRAGRPSSTVGVRAEAWATAQYASTPKEGEPDRPAHTGCRCDRRHGVDDELDVMRHSGTGQRAEVQWLTQGHAWCHRDVYSERSAGLPRIVGLHCGEGPDRRNR
ncbi:hypothetical protein GCM10010266_58850 [Streptomyces griseomycini]|nr:hypothetical protein GCM10010266_58850 [Streptomyces griseomycini]GGR35617.1 hypothetical protein GCM10015536_46690 [Streptomyces griseomycini]